MRKRVEAPAPKRRSSGARKGSAATPAIASTEDALLQAALELFVERGYHGTSIRDIAARSGSSLSHVYYYFPSKAHVLKSMMVDIVSDLIDALTEASRKAGPTSTDRLRALVTAEVLFHCQRQSEAFVGRSELRSLSADDRKEVIVLYDRVTAIFRDAVDQGVKAGEFACEHRAEAARAILTMCNAVSSWFRAEGRLSPPTIAARYAQLALHMVGAL